MAIPKLYSLARMTTATTGTGTITLGSAATVNSILYLSFAAAGVADGETVAYAIADVSNSEYGYGVYTSAGTTLTRNVVRSTNSNNAISLSGSAQVFITAGGTDLLMPSLSQPRNFSLSATVAGNALTIAVKDAGGSDPSALSPVYVDIRSPTASSGVPVSYAIRSATSLVVSSGSTLGTTNSTAFRLAVVLFDDGGTLRVGVINALTTAVDPGGVASSTAEGGAGGADSANTYYTGTAVTSKAFAIIGYLDYPSGLATAGTWSSAPTTVQAWGAGSGAAIPVSYYRIITPNQIRSPSIAFTSTSGVIGTTTNDSAAAGSVGELLSGSLASGSATALTTGTAKTVTSVSLTAGDWEVTGVVRFTGAGSTTVGNILVSSVSLVDNTVDQSNDRMGAVFYPSSTPFAASFGTIPIPAGPTRISLSATTTVYLVAYADFAVSTCSAYGIVRARRVR